MQYNFFRVCVNYIVWTTSTLKLDVKISPSDQLLVADSLEKLLLNAVFDIQKMTNND